MHVVSKPRGNGPEAPSSFLHLASGNVGVISSALGAGLMDLWGELCQDLVSIAMSQSAQVRRLAARIFVPLTQLSPP